MIKIREIEDNVSVIVHSPNVERDVTAYIVDLLKAHTDERVSYDFASFCIKCINNDILSKPTIYEKHLENGSMDRWVECPECHNISSIFNDCGKDAETLAIKDWNNKN